MAYFTNGIADQKLNDWCIKSTDQIGFVDFFISKIMIQFTKSQAQLFSNIAVSVAMTVVMTGGMLLVHSGYFIGFFKLWAKDFIIGCLIAIPTGLLIVPIISKWIDRHTNNVN